MTDYFQDGSFEMEVRFSGPLFSSKCNANLIAVNCLSWTCDRLYSVFRASEEGSLLVAAFHVYSGGFKRGQSSQ